MSWWLEARYTDFDSGLHVPEGRSLPLIERFLERVVVDTVSSLQRVVAGTQGQVAQRFPDRRHDRYHGVRAGYLVVL